MANTIRLKRASGSDPSASDLVTGELAIRTDTGKLFTKKDDNSINQIGGGIANVVDDSSPQLGGDLASNGSDIDFADTDKAIFGNDGDLEIFHDGSDSYVQAISNGSGDLYVIANTKSIYLRPKTNENGIKIVPDGAVELYHDNSKKLETTANGLAQTGMLAIPDGGKDSGQNHIRFGNDGDLRIYHSGSHSFVQDVGTGSLKLAGADVQIVNSDNSAVLAQFIAGGKSELRHDGNTKFETASSGVSVTGNITVSGTVDGRDVATDGTKLDGIESNATADQTAGEIKTLLQSDKLTASEIANDTITAVQLANNSANVNVIVDSAVTTAKIANNAVTASKLPNSEVTFAKLQDVSQNRIIGRISSGSGVLQELTAANIRSIINVADGATNVTNTNQLTNGAGFITSADGGNAATLDSIDSSQFLRSDTADTATGVLTINGGLSFGADAKCPAAVSSLSDGSTVTVDFTSGIHHSVTLGGNRTLSQVNNANAIGQSGSIFITQDGTGSRTLAYNSAYKFVGGTAPTLSTAANAVDRLDYVIKASGVIHCVVSLDVK